MRSEVLAETVVVTQGGVIFVAQQVNRDLVELSKAYPRILPLDRASLLFNSLTTFMINYAIKLCGYSIYDPTASNLVYHELRYKILYGGDVQRLNPSGTRTGTGGNPITPVPVPPSAQFTPWVVWSDHMRNLSQGEQRQIVSGTGWSIPSEGGTFTATYAGGDWSSRGFYSSGGLAAEGSEWIRR